MTFGLTWACMALMQYFANRKPGSRLVPRLALTSAKGVSP